MQAFEVPPPTNYEGHELDRKWRVPKEMVGRRLSQEQAKKFGMRAVPTSPSGRLHRGGAAGAKSFHRKSHGV